MEVVLLALAQCKAEAAIEEVVKGLSLEAADVLMKYLFRALGRPSNASPSQTQLFKWHSSLVKHHGLGPITRALTDRQTV